MDYSPPGASAHGIIQARILEWIAIFLSLIIIQPPALLTFLEGGAENFNTLITWLVPLATCPQPKELSKSHLLNINSEVVERRLFRITKDTHFTFVLLTLKIFQGF